MFEGLGKAVPRALKDEKPEEAKQQAIATGTGGLVAMLVPFAARQRAGRAVEFRDVMKCSGQ